MTLSAATTRALGTASIDDLDTEISRLFTDINAASYRVLMLIRQFDERMGWARWSFRNCSEWLAWRGGITLSAAREKVRTAHALRDLPQISIAFAEGTLSYSKVRALTRAADARNEDELLRYAVNATATQVEERCRQLRNVRVESIGDARRAWERRTLSVWRNDSRGTMTLSVEVPIEAGELITQALDLAISAGESAAGPEFAESSWHSQQADALVTVAKAYLAGTVAERTSAADQYQVVVHVDETALRGGVGRADLPVESVRRLTCDGSVVEVVETEDGRPLDVSRKRRTVPTALKRALWARDRGCSFPGCHNTRFVDAHHVEHWSAGGATDLDNLTLLCSHHHRLVHEGGYALRRDHQGELYFRRADGRVIPGCGYRAADAEPDPVDLEDTSAEGFLADMVKRRKPSAEVREGKAEYSCLAADMGRSRAQPSQLS